MAAPDVVWKNGRFGQTSRRDNGGYAASGFPRFRTFLVYANWAAFQNKYYTFGPYLSPFYSPELLGDSPHAWFGPKPSWYPDLLPFSPALFILWIPGLFRFTCYYYRGAYYKSFWADPPACTVGEPRKTYLGERSFPLILQNFHRYFLRLSYIVWGFLVYDAWKAFWFDERLRHRSGDASCLLSTSCCSAATCSAAMPSGIWSADPSTRFRIIPPGTSFTTASAASTAATRNGPGRASSRSGSPISTCASAAMGIWSDWRIL